MKKILIIVLFILTSCVAPDYSGYNTKSVNNVIEKDATVKKEYQWHTEKFRKVNEGIGSFIVVRHEATGILYLINYEGGVIMLVNPDGTPYIQE